MVSKTNIYKNFQGTGWNHLRAKKNIITENSSSGKNFNKSVTNEIKNQEYSTNKNNVFAPNKTSYQGTGWKHFAAKNITHQQGYGKPYNKNQENSQFYEWVMDTLNPINHIPVISTVKKIYSKTSKSLDIVQSVIGGMIYGGPLGILKGLGGWASQKILYPILSSNEKKPLKVKDMDQTNILSKNKKNISSNTNNPVEHSKDKKVIREINSSLMRNKLSLPFSTYSYKNNYTISNNKSYVDYEPDINKAINKIDTSA